MNRNDFICSFRPGIRPIFPDSPSKNTSEKKVETGEETVCLPFSKGSSMSADMIIANSITKASHITSKTIENSSYEISRNILAASKEIVSSLNNISSEVERANKSKEYYMLLKEIELFEDYCIENQILKDVYQKMDLTQHSPIKDDMNFYYAMALVCAFDYGDITILEKFSYQLSLSPIQALAFLFMKGASEYRGVIYISDVGLKMYDHLGILRSHISCNNMETIINVLWTSIISAYNLSRDDLPSSLTGYIQENASKLMSVVPNLNRDIELRDLKSLHNCLRLAVRNHKVETAMSK